MKIKNLWNSISLFNNRQDIPAALFVLKKILGFLCALVMMCSVLTTTAFADAYVVSPGHGGDNPPSSPQTGYETGIGAVMAVALAGGTVAVVAGSKLRRDA